MLISHRHRFIYTKTVKTAGTSVEAYFEKYCMREGEWELKHARDVYASEAGIIGFRGTKLPRGTEWFHHMGAAAIKSKVGEEVWNGYFKFCVIRDPFDKAVSAFYHFKKDRERAALNSGKPGLRLRLKRLLKPEPKFAGVAEEFEHWLAGGNMGVDRDKYVIDGEFCMDEVVRYESLQDDLRKVCDRIGVEFEPERLPEFKKGKRDTSVSLREIYTPKSVGIVSDLFSYELDRFGYAFPEA